ncbi:MAG: hypothetical protein QOF51_2110 [Chloroflexota bacterium]|nr:hypothetical protein [Chloroflexota bacterium]
MRCRALAIACVVALLIPIGTVAPIVALAQEGDQPTQMISIGDNFFDPSDATVASGTMVVWENDGFELHTVTSLDGIFDSGLVDSGEQFSLTFTTPGTYAYRCLVHDDMTGSITVTDASADNAGITTAISPAPTAVALPTQAPPSIPATAVPQPPAAQPVPSAPSNVSVDISNFSFQPASITVAAGGTVRWTNRDATTHTATSDGGTFDAGRIASGSSATATFNTRGQFAYHCAIHPTMHGTVNVV